MTISHRTRRPPAPPSSRAEQLELRERARRFVDDVLIPNEELAERSGGKIPDELEQRIKREAIEARLSGGLHAPEHGGQGWTKTEWFLVEEQLGRSTNALSWHMPGAYNVLASGTPGADRALSRPALRGELHDAYAVTEAEAGSDPSRIATSARRRTPAGSSTARSGSSPMATWPRSTSSWRTRSSTASGCRRCSWSTATAAASRSWTTRRSRTPIRTAIRRSASPASRCRTTRSSAGSAAATNCSAPGSPRSGSASPPAASARCGA